MNLKERLANSAGTAQGRVLAPAEGQPAADRLAADMDLINRHALVDLSPEDVFAFQFELSNSNVDAYFTRMTRESLDNYAARINGPGVPLLGNHDGMTWPIGRIYWAEVARTDDGVDRLACRAYIVRGDQNDGLSGDAIIRKVETGVQKDASIGFVPGGYTCSICGRAMVPGFFSRAEGVECEHIPGAEYDGKVAYAWVEDATILEGSLVYTGATPQAMIDKALNAAKLGKLRGVMLNSVCNALHIQPPVTEQPPMKGKDLLTRVAAANGIGESLRSRLQTRAEAMSDETEEQGAEAVAEEVAKVEQENQELKAENASLQEDAKDGKEYRDALVEEALAEGVRALGNDFRKDEMERHLRAAGIPHIRAMAAQYRAITERLAGQVNLTRDEKVPVGDDRERAKGAPVPDAAFK